MHEQKIPSKPNTLINFRATRLGLWGRLPGYQAPQSRQIFFFEGPCIAPFPCREGLVVVVHPCAHACCPGFGAFSLPLAYLTARVLVLAGLVLADVVLPDLVLVVGL